MYKGSFKNFFLAKTTHRLLKVIAVAVSSCLLVAMVSIDASASGFGSRDSNSARSDVVSTLESSNLQLSGLVKSWSTVSSILPTTPPATTTSTATGGGGGDSGSGGGASATTTPPTTTTTTPPTTTTTTTASGTTTSDAQYRLDLGLEVKTGLWDVAPVKSVESAIGHKISVVMGYIAWAASENNVSDFPTAQLDALSNDGYLPEITWEPWNDSNGVNQPNYSLASIIDGGHDSYIQAWAEAAKAYGKPLLIRFAQEMNGTWYPWSEQVNGNSPGEYVQAWQHVHNIFAEDGVTNVKWIWSPNFVGSGASSDLAELYPGNAYVDYVGIDGYSYPNDGCPAASELFGPTLAITSQLSDRPVMIAETGIDTACSSQTSLMASLLNWASANPRIIALTWFDRDIASADYSLSSSVESTIHSFVSPVTMRSDEPDGFQS